MDRRQIGVVGEEWMHFMEGEKGSVRDVEWELGKRRRKGREGGNQRADKKKRIMEISYRTH